MEEILAANAALLLIEKLIPVIEAKVKSGEVTKEEQQAFRDRYVALRDKGDAAFAAPHWQVE